MIVKLYKYQQCWWFDYKQRIYEIRGIDSLLDKICDVAEISKLYIKLEKIDPNKPFPSHKKYLAYLCNPCGSHIFRNKRYMNIDLIGYNLAQLGKIFGIPIYYYGRIEIMGFINMHRYMMITQIK